MKHFKKLCIVLMLLCSTMAMAHDFAVGGIYYRITSSTNKTVAVSYGGSDSDSYPNEYNGSVVIPETVTMSKTVKTFNAWTSTNKGAPDTTSQTSYTLKVAAGNILKFDWSVSSQSNYDWLIITLDGKEIVKKSGTLSGSYEKTFDAAGSHTLVVKYTKNGFGNEGNDEGKIFNVTLNVKIGVEYRVTSIVDYAFSYCSGLTSVVIPNSVEKIGHYSFYRCDNLINIVLEEGNAIYDSRDNCNAIIETATNTLVVGCKNTIIPNSVTSIGKNAFRECYGLTSITIPNGVTSIGDYAFYGCSGLTSVEIPNSVTSIGGYAFYGCSGLTSVEIPNSVTSIEYAAFGYCSGLTSIVIPNSVTSIGDYAFYDCDGLTSIEIPNSVTSIGGYTFYDCSGITSVVIGNSVTSIGESAFSNCSGLKEVHISDLVAWCNIDFVTAYANPLVNAKNLYLNGELLTNAIIPETVTKIKFAAFYGCSGLTSVVIPNSVTSIGKGAFCYCSGLTSVEIPNSVTSIGDYAFYGCSGLTSVEIPNSVTSIEYAAFAYCDGLTSVVIPNSVTSIGDYAFSNCI